MIASTCEICGHIFAEKHRVIPGKVDGIYIPKNIVWLCPNHHAAIHYMMTWNRKMQEDFSPMLDPRYIYYTTQDKDFAGFFNAISLPYIKALQTLRKHRASGFSKLPKEVAMYHAQQICYAVAEWKKEFSKGKERLTFGQVIKKNNINLDDEGFDE